jgi:hypothetical protein
MRYYAIWEDGRIRSRWHLDDVTSARLEGEEVAYLLTSGRRFTEPTVDVELQYPAPPMDFTITAFAVPIVSSKVAAAIESHARGDVQRVPAAIKGHFGFEALNVLRLVDCIDESKSEFQKWTERDNQARPAGTLWNTGLQVTYPPISGQIGYSWKDNTFFTEIGFGGPQGVSIMHYYIW